MSASPPTLSISGAVSRLSLNRPEQHNRLNSADLQQLLDHLNTVNQRPEVRILILESSGPSFSAGYDLNGLNAQGAGAQEFEQASDAIENLTAVTIARLHAPVYGGTSDLALACDFRIGADTICLRMPAAGLGLHLYGQALRRWVSRLGLGPAKKLFLTARTISAAEMLAIGFLDAMVPAKQLDEEIQSWTSDLLAVAPLPLRSMKVTLNAAALGAFDASQSRAAQEDSLKSADFAEALDAFAEKRRPVFIGR